MSKDQELAKRLLKGKEVFKGKYVERYKVSTGSLQLDIATEGGIGAGIHRLCGENEGGKTAESLVILDNFLKSKGTKPRKGIFINAEFRLSKQKRNSVSFDFIDQSKITEWNEGSCLILDTNSYETSASLTDAMVNEQDFQYCIVIDSLDALIPDGDVNKSFSDSHKVAGGAVIASTLSKRISIPTRKFGHMVIFISQVRSKIHQGMGHAPAEQVNSTGGNALLHASDYILEFKAKRNQGNLLKEADGMVNLLKNKKFGHMAFAKICKSENESTGYTVEYPIKYVKNVGRIWIEKEVFDLMKAVGILEGTAWLSLPIDLDDPIYEFAKKMKVKLEKPVKLQGEKAWLAFLEDNPELTNLFYSYLANLLV